MGLNFLDVSRAGALAASPIFCMEGRLLDLGPHSLDLYRYKPILFLYKGFNCLDSFIHVTVYHYVTVVFRLQIHAQTRFGLLNCCLYL